MLSRKSLFLLSLLLLSLFSAKIYPYSILADADMHVEAEDKTTKIGHVELMTDMINTPTHYVKCVVMPGDLTNSGLNGSISLWPPLHPQFDEWGKFLTQWFNPLQNAGADIFVGKGNHDTDHEQAQFISVPEAIQNLYDNQDYYVRDILSNNGTKKAHIICCGLYPDAITRLWLSVILNSLKLVDGNLPVYIFFHYFLPDYWVNYDWMPAQDKEDFYNVIKDYNIKAIINGHIHTSYCGYWHNIPIIGVGGNYFAKIEHKTITNEFTVTFHKDRNTAARTWDDEFIDFS